MKNYRVQNGCWNCKYIFVYDEYDVGEIYFCNINNNRPRCGSIMIGEHFSTHWEDFLKETEKWRQWAEKHLVENFGICDNYKKIDCENS